MIVTLTCRPLGVRQPRSARKIALRWTRGGFGTPFFGSDEQVRVEGDRLVLQAADSAAELQIRTLNQAAALVLRGDPDEEWAREFDVPALGDIDETLSIDPAAARFLGDWYGFAWSLLEELRADKDSEESSRVQLWPEHFDAAFECGLGAARAGYGASPGDAAVAEPYLYVVPWVPDEAEVHEGPTWNASSFRGAILTLSEIARADDQRTAALDFYRARRSALRG